jgi:hypothetical protein
MTEAIANSETALQTIIGELRQAFAARRWLKVKWTDAKRSIPQNDISHAWYEQLARELPQEDAIGWKSYCKLHHGVPILRAEDADFRAMYDAALLGLSYEQKREVMKFMPVTSLMNKSQLSRYLEAVRDDLNRQGAFLQFPEAA